MLGLHLRQRGLRASQAHVAGAGQLVLRHNDSRLLSSTDGKPPGSDPSEPGTSATTQSSPAGAAPTQTSNSVPPKSYLKGSPATGSANPPSVEASPSTAAGLQQLRNRLATSTSATARPISQQVSAVSPQQPAQKAQQPGQPPSKPGSSAPPSSPAPAPQPARTANFQGQTLQLGERDSMLQAMAILTHSSPQQTADYAANPGEGDARFLAGLQRMSPSAQQRAASVMRLAAGAVPPPPVLIWARQQLLKKVRALVQEGLQRQQEASQAPAGADGAAAATPYSVRSEVWYDGALQLARVVVPSRTVASLRTDVDLLRAFAERSTHEAAASDASTSSPPSATTAAPPSPAPAAGDQVAVAAAAEAPGAAAATPAAAAKAAAAVQEEPRRVFFAMWDTFLALPQLHVLLDAAVVDNPSLESVLELSGLRRPSAAAASAPAAPTAQAWLLPQLRTTAAAARDKAIRAAGLAGVDGGIPLDTDAVLTALALRPPPQVAAAARSTATEWLSATVLLSRVEAALGVLGSSGGMAAAAVGARQELVALLQLLELPLEPSELQYMEEMKVPEADVRAWISQTAAQLAAAGSTAASATASGAVNLSGMPLPPALTSRLATARARLAASGRALVIHSGSAGSTRESEPSLAATSAWLRTVGAPLVSGLLSGGYDSLARLRPMVPELREALVLRLLEEGRVGGGVAALTAALYGDAAAAWRAARTEAAQAAAAAALLHREAVAAELDLVHERFVPPAPALPPPLALPSDKEVRHLVSSFPASFLQMYDSYYSLQPEAVADAVAAGSRKEAGAVLAEQRKVVEALAVVGEAATQKAADGNLQAWLTDARKGLLMLPMPLLGLLLRFLKVQVSVTPEAAALQREKLTALLTVVAEQQRRAAAAAAAGAAGGSAGGEDAAATRAAGGSPGGAASSSAVAQELSEWAASGGSAGASGRVPAALASMLGREGALDFASWLQAVTLTSRAGLPSHVLLAQQSAEMDVERYLTMTHDPRLALPASGVGPAARPSSSDWTHPDLRRSEGDWLEAMRPHLDSYLAAMGHRPLADAEWCMYRDTALAEWAEGGAERGAREAAAGESGFWNPRADEMYLRELVDRNIAPDAPLGPQSRRYVDTLIRNPTWTFAQRLRAVQRLTQLNDYFTSQPAAPADGSPFAPLFTPNGPDPVPRLEPLQPPEVLQAGGKGTTGAKGAAAGGGGGGGKSGKGAKMVAEGSSGGAGGWVLKLPDGF